MIQIRVYRPHFGNKENGFIFVVSGVRCLGYTCYYKISRKAELGLNGASLMYG